MAKRPISRFLKQDEFFKAIAHAVYAHSLISFLCDIEYPSLEHEFILASHEAISEEFDSLREILLSNFPRDADSTLECQNYVREYFGVGIEILHVAPFSPVKLHIVDHTVSIIGPSFLQKEEMMMVIGQASIAHKFFMDMDSFHVSDRKEEEKRSLLVITAILLILLRELSSCPPLIPLCEEYVMEAHELPIPFHLL